MTQTDADALSAAIEDARAVLDSDGATQAEVDAATAKFAAFCGKAGSVLALALDERSSVIGGFVKGHAAGISRGYVFGGEASVSAETMKALEEATK